MQIVGSARTAVFVLQGAVVFVLLIACANLANLLLARAESRHKEFAVRTALGAGRWRLLRQFMVEGCVLSFAGAALGLGVAVAGVRALDRRLSRQPAAIGGRRARRRRSRVHVARRPRNRRGVRPRAAAASRAGRDVARVEGRRHADHGRRRPQPHPPRPRRRGSGAGRRARHRRGAAAPHGDEPLEGRRRLQSQPAGDVRGDAAEREVLEGGAGAGVLRAADRAPAIDRGRAERRRDDRAAAAAAGGRERHRHRRLRGAAEGAVRERRLLPDRHLRLRRDDGHSGRRRPRVPACRRERDHRAHQRDDGADVLARPEPDRPPRQAWLRRRRPVLHHRRRAQGREAGRRR